MSSLHPFRLLVLSFVLAVTGSSLQARSINWGSSVGASLYLSDGTVFGTDMIFEVGSFGSDFTPTSNNMNEWFDAWKTFDRAIEGTGWNSEDQFLSKTANVNLNGTSSSTFADLNDVFTTGERGYIWVYQNSFNQSPGEWALITNNSLNGTSDDWLFPVHSDQTSLPLEWRFSNASHVIYGGLNNTQGPGSYTVNPVTFSLQTHIFTPVPEPSSALLLAATLILAQRRRRQTLADK